MTYIVKNKGRKKAAEIEAVSKAGAEKPAKGMRGYREGETEVIESAEAIVKTLLERKARSNELMTHTSNIAERVARAAKAGYVYQHSRNYASLVEAGWIPSSLSDNATYLIERGGSKITHYLKEASPKRWRRKNDSQAQSGAVAVDFGEHVTVYAHQTVVGDVLIEFLTPPESGEAK